MMKSSANRIAWLLAVSGISDKEILDALRVIKTSGEDNFLERIKVLRQSTNVNISQLREELPDFVVKPNRREDDRYNTADEVMRLLLRDARLPPSVAAERLVKSIEREGLSQHTFQKFRAKDGFRKWLVRLPISHAEVLHHATKIRNELAHSGTAHWPLRDRKK